MLVVEFLRTGAIIFVWLVLFRLLAMKAQGSPIEHALAFAAC